MKRSGILPAPRWRPARRARSVVAALCITVLSAPDRAAAGDDVDAPPAPPPLTVPFTAGRAGLDPGEAAWSWIAGALPVPQIGYTPGQMDAYSRDRHVLRTVRALFDNVDGAMRFSGRVTDELLAAADDPMEAVRLAFLLVDVSAGRMLPGPPATGAADVPFGVEWLDETLDTRAALELVLTDPDAIDAAGRRAWHRLPEPIRRGVLRLIIAARESKPWFLDALDRRLLSALSADRMTMPADPAEVVALLSRPWIERAFGLTAVGDRRTLDLIGAVSLERIAFGSAVALVHLRAALADFAAWKASGDTTDLELLRLSFSTPIGRVQVFGTAGDVIDRAAAITVDLGGSDLWVGAHGVPVTPDLPAAFAIDLGGNDLYDAGDHIGALGCGVLGIGVLVDFEGDDVYVVSSSGLGYGLYGTGLLIDLAGDDRYEVRDRWGQGAAHVGVGMLIDLAGDDVYICGTQAQGLGSTRGAGILVDVQGNDRYIARDDGNPSPLYLGQSVAMAQGCGFGRRADIGDGDSLAGGFGILVDGAGDDRYEAPVWAQGAGYWWGVGIIEDRGGNDTWRSHKYSLGSAAHFAIGICIDLSGDDRYNQGNTDAVNQFQGHARDGSIGVFVDGDGDDHYFLRSHCGGSGDLGSIGLFWDRRGADVYEVRLTALGEPNGWNETAALGSSTAYPPFRSFRDDLATIGLFMDTGGTNRWIGDVGAAGDGRTWTQHRGPRFRGLGLAAIWFDPGPAP